MGWSGSSASVTTNPHGVDWRRLPIAIDSGPPSFHMNPSSSPLPSESLSHSIFKEPLIRVSDDDFLVGRERMVGERLVFAVAKELDRSRFAWEVKNISRVYLCLRYTRVCFCGVTIGGSV
ncbi:hypothetical protein QJS10_CPA02g01495 [Acorus calamus]|uniref:Uncharacterized protein n=1 Tax=Acorus calamus TaxID=4465 RepID=A0AAV9FDK9_ACOCL|nr:hypothetical protein QJS10_CPA02g01495 [Acorus calamus]